MNPLGARLLGKRRVVILLVLSIVALLVIAACASGSGPPTNPAPPDVDINIRMNLDQDTAVSLVRQHVSRSGGNVMVQVPYWETTTQKVTCHGDPQSQGCYADSFSVTGFSKDIRGRERRYRSELRSLPSQSSWEAVYQPMSDEWIIKAEFSVEDVRQTIEWIVNDDSREVSESR